MADNNNEYDRSRRRVYGGVLLFAVTAAILLTAVPPLRARLFDRIDVIKTAMVYEIQHDIMPVGENDLPYPEEFLRTAFGAVVSSPYVEPAPKRLIVVQPEVITPPVLSKAGRGSPAGVEEETKEAEDDSDALRFRQGETEREAYEKTLATNVKLAAMVQGGNPDISFKTWDAVHRDGDVYWVRVIFQNAAGTDVEYIWQTDISSDRSTPLNFNARSL